MLVTVDCSLFLHHPMFERTNGKRNTPPPPDLNMSLFECNGIASVLKGMGFPYYDLFTPTAIKAEGNKSLSYGFAACLLNF